MMSLEALDKKLDTPPKAENKAPQANWITSLFTLPEKLTQSNKLKIYKSMALRESTGKNGVVYTGDNVHFAAGGMKAAALLKQSFIYIDHHKTLPPEYEEKYPGISKVYPVGLTIDAVSVDAEHDGKKVKQIENIPVINNEVVNQLIDEGKVKGVSIDDTFRKCEDCGTEKCACKPQGSSPLTMSLMLEATPNIDGTWIAALEESELEKLVTIDPNAKPLENQLSTDAQKVEEHMKQGYEAAQKNATELMEYWKDGKWQNESATAKFLQEKREIPEQVANEISHIITEQNIMSPLQVATLAKDDWLAWHKVHVENALIDRRMQVKNFIINAALEKHQDIMDTITKAEKKLENFAPYGQSEVKYGTPDEGKNCGACRFYMPDKDPAAGHCVIVSGDIYAAKGCKEFSELPGTEHNEEAPDPDNPDAPAEAPKPEGDQPDKVMPDAEGKCPAGYHLSEDSTECVKDMPAQEAPPQSAQSMTLKDVRGMNKPQPTATIDENTATAKLENQIEAMKLKLSMLPPLKPGDLRGAVQRTILQNDLLDLEKLKKK